MPHTIQHSPLDDLFNQPLPSSTLSGQATIQAVSAAVAEGAQATQELAKQGQSNLEDVLRLNKAASEEAARTRDFTAEISQIEANNKIATAELNKAPTEQYVASSTNKTTRTNLDNAVINRQNLQADINELNADDSFLGTIKRAVVGPIFNRQLNAQDQQISQIQRRRAQSAIDYNQQMITNTKVADNRSAKEMAQVVHNAKVSKSAFDAFRLQGQLSKDNILALSAQAGLTSQSTNAFEKQLNILKNENRFYLDAVNAEIVKLQLEQQDASNAKLKKATANDAKYFELQQSQVDQFLTETGREDQIGKIKAQSLLTTGAKTKDPLFSQFRTWQFTTQSSALAPYSTFQRKLSAGAINPNNPQDLAVQREAKAVVKAANSNAQRINDELALTGQRPTAKILNINDPEDIAKIDELILKERAMTNKDATSAFSTEVLAIPSLLAFKNNPTPEAKEELLKTFPADVLEYIESGKMDKIPTTIGSSPQKDIANTIVTIASSYADLSTAQVEVDIRLRSKALAGYYGWARRGLATTSMQGLTSLQFRGVDTFRTGEGQLKDPIPFDITSEGQWSIRLKRAYLQRLQIDRLSQSRLDFDVLRATTLSTQPKI